MSSTGCRYAVTVLCYITSHHIYHYTCTWNTKRPIVLWSEPTEHLPSEAVVLLALRTNISPSCESVTLKSNVHALAKRCIGNGLPRFSCN